MNPSSFSGIYENLFEPEIIRVPIPSEDGGFEEDCYEISVSPDDEITVTHK